MTRAHSPLVAVGLPLWALAVSVIAFSPRGSAFAQDVPGDEPPARATQQPPSPPPPPQPPPSPAHDRAEPPAMPPNTPLASGFTEDIPPLPRGTVAAPGYPTPRYQLRYEERRMTGLMTAGFAIFGGAWFMSAVFGGYVSDHGWFAMPLIGPVIYKSDNKAEQAAIIMDTIVQASGLAMALAGVFVKQKVAVRAPITLLPTPMHGGGGLALSGSW